MREGSNPKRSARALTEYPPLAIAVVLNSDAEVARATLRSAAALRPAETGKATVTVIVGPERLETTRSGVHVLDATSLDADIDLMKRAFSETQIDMARQAERVGTVENVVVMVSGSVAPLPFSFEEAVLLLKMPTLATAHDLERGYSLLRKNPTVAAVALIDSARGPRPRRATREALVNAPLLVRRQSLDQHAPRRSVREPGYRHELLRNLETARYELMALPVREPGTPAPAASDL
ncbi:MAG: hypothetical protein AAGK22_17820 [Acidobacteriota bacterium]